MAKNAVQRLIDGPEDDCTRSAVDQHFCQDRGKCACMDEIVASVADMRHQLWLLLGDAKARSVSCTCYPPLTKDERHHIERAEALLAGYEPAE